MTPRWYIPRRTILRGIGAAIPLPFLEAMVGPRLKRAVAAGDPKSNPRRFVGIWGFPCGLVAKWDPIQSCPVSPWTQDGVAGPLTGVDKQGYLKPFWDPQNVGWSKEPLWKKLLIPAGLSDVSLGLHQSTAALLSPGRPRCVDEGGNYCEVPRFDVVGQTADQLAATYLGQYTQVSSLALGTYKASGGGVNSYPYATFLSWKDRYTYLPKEVDPGAVFDKLFGRAIPPADPAAAKRQQILKKSVLDTVLGHVNDINKKVGKQDKVKLAEYLDSINEIEKRIQTLSYNAACMVPGKPSSGAPTASQGLSTLDKRIQVMADLIVKGFQCDMTRVATLTFTDAYGSTIGYPFLTDEAGRNMGGLYHHDMSHFITGDMTIAPPAVHKAYMVRWGKFVVEMFAYLCKELDKWPDPDGNTLLDNSAVLIGGDQCDGDVHSWNSTNILVAGRAGRTDSSRWGINAGRQMRFNPAWPAGACGDVGSEFEQVGSMAKGYCHPNRGLEAAHVEPNSVSPMPDLQFPGEKTVKDLLWGLLNAIGIPQDKTKQWAATGTASAPLDLSSG